MLVVAWSLISERSERVSSTMRCMSSLQLVRILAMFSFHRYCTSALTCFCGTTRPCWYLEQRLIARLVLLEELNEDGAAVDEAAELENVAGDVDVARDFQVQRALDVLQTAAEFLEVLCVIGERRGRYAVEGLAENDSEVRFVVLEEFVGEQAFDLEVANNPVVHVARDLDRLATTASERGGEKETDSCFACSRRLCGSCLEGR